MKPWLFLGASEGAITLAAQAQLIPENLLSILARLPLVAVIIWLQLQNQKWLERMLKIQRESIKEIYDGQNKFLDNLLRQIEAKQEQMTNNVDNLKDEVAMMRATLGEAINVKDVVDQLVDRIAAK
jgi:hypothetical protein